MEEGGGCAVSVLVSVFLVLSLCCHKKKGNRRGGQLASEANESGLGRITSDGATGSVSPLPGAPDDASFPDHLFDVSGKPGSGSVAVVNVANITPTTPDLKEKKAEKDGDKAPGTKRCSTQKRKKVMARQLDALMESQTKNGTAKPKKKETVVVQKTRESTESVDAGGEETKAAARGEEKAEKSETGTGREDGLPAEAVEKVKPVPGLARPDSEEASLISDSSSRQKASLEALMTPRAKKVADIKRGRRATFSDPAYQTLAHLHDKDNFPTDHPTPRTKPLDPKPGKKRRKQLRPRQYTNTIEKRAKVLQS